MSPDTHLRRGPELQLLGWWDLRVQGLQVSLAHREQRLVALLALNGCRSRPHIAGTLWPDATESRALNSLRAAVLQTQRAVPGLLELGRGALGLRRDIRVDVHGVREFAEAIAEPGTRYLDDAIDTLVTADLLPGWYEDWVLYERDRLLHLRLRSLESLASNALKAGDAETAVAGARGALAIEPLRESALALVIRAHLLNNNRVEAIREYQAYRRRLRRELDIAPSSELTRIVTAAVSV
jgi:DNA-binding SARP family transcriptional activator